MRDLNEQEMKVLDHLRDAVNVFLFLPESHPADEPEFIIHIHGLQNIVMSRPAMERFIELDEEKYPDDERD